MLKKLMMGAALATLLASPALAQAADPNFASGAVNAVDPVPPYAAGPQYYAYAPHAYRSRAYRSFAYVPGAAGPIYSGRVYVDGKYVGQDPDPNVRLQLQRDYPRE